MATTYYKKALLLRETDNFFQFDPIDGPLTQVIPRRWLLRRTRP